MSKILGSLKKTFICTNAIFHRHGLNVVQQRWFSDIVLESLKARSLLRVQGPEAAPFLQGLITNDMNNFEHGSNSIYAMFLNTSGRVLYDSLIYQVERKREDFLVECDASVVDQLRKHLNLFRVRKKVEISKPDWNVWVAFTQNGDPPVAKSDDKSTLIFKDSRLKDLGHRIITDKSFTIDRLKNLFPQKTNFTNNTTYEHHRYILGVGEGVRNLPQAKCFPLESNCDYLRGISFHKGCYIGQELTARTHHTGVVRKRLMPLIFDDHIAADEVLDEAEIKTENGQVVGKLRGCNVSVGLGLLRVEKVLSSRILTVADKYRCTTFKPKWWP